MDQYGDKIRQLKTVGPLRFDEETTSALSEYQSRCYARNLRGECANPNVLDEDGQMMSWKKYDELKARGIDPRSVSDARLNRPANSRFRPSPSGGIQFKGSLGGIMR